MPPRRAELRDLLEQVVVRREEEREPRRERRRPARPAAMRLLHVLDRVRERERELLHRRRAGLADVVAGDRDRIPVRHLGGAEAEDLRDQREARARRIDVRAARDVLLEDVVLHRARELRRARCRAPPPRRCTSRAASAAVALIVIDVDTRVERQPVEQRVHVLDRVDRDADAPDLAERARRIGVDAHLRRAGRTRPRARSARRRAGAWKRSFVSARRAEAGVLAHRPQPAAVHRRLHAARERKAAGIAEVARVVDRRVVRPVGRLDGMPEGEKRSSVICRTERSRRSEAASRNAAAEPTTRDERHASRCSTSQLRRSGRRLREPSRARCASIALAASTSSCCR